VGSGRIIKARYEIVLRLSINTSFIVVRRILAALFQKLSCSITRIVNKRWSKLGGRFEEWNEEF
jgi:hypothetical protein